MHLTTTDERASICVPLQNISGKFLTMRRAIPRCSRAPMSVSSPSRPLLARFAESANRYIRSPKGVSFPALCAFSSSVAG